MQRITRQQKRALQRKLANSKKEDVERIIAAAEEAKRQEVAKQNPAVVVEVIRRVREIEEPGIRSKAIADTLIMIMAYEHIDRGHTGTYLKKWLRGFNDFGIAVGNEGGGVDGLRKILLEECGLDLAAELRDIGVGGGEQ